MDAGHRQPVKWRPVSNQSDRETQKLIILSILKFIVKDCRCCFEWFRRVSHESFDQKFGENKLLVCRKEHTYKSCTFCASSQRALGRILFSAGELLTVFTSVTATTSLVTIVLSYSLSLSQADQKAAQKQL